jgi:hypothetical protein
MIVVSVWGGRSIRDDVRVPVRISSTGVEATVSKATALVLWPLLGGVVFFGTFLADDDGEIPEGLAGLGLSLLVILLLLQLSMIRRAARS